MESRKTHRYNMTLPAYVLGHIAEDRDCALKGTIVSFSAGGCAIRTTSRLDETESLVLEIELAANGPTRALRIPARVVWGRDDFRIDTFYLYGVRFLEPLSEMDLMSVLGEESLAASIPVKHPSRPAHKIVA